ncbi:MAG: hypothetical protein M3N24_11725 [Actinomycetota bacterium]|nr:hypothetical protein [Actinomycetota bacterium]
MPRRRIYVPETVDALIRDATRDGESYSAALARLVEAGDRSLRGRKSPAYVASGEGPNDLGRRAEWYLENLVPGR